MLEIEGHTLLQTEWGTYSLTTVVLKLIGMVLEEPPNTRFVLPSDSDIPFLHQTMEYGFPRLQFDCRRSGGRTR